MLSLSPTNSTLFVKPAAMKPLLPKGRVVKFYRVQKPPARPRNTLARIINDNKIKNATFDKFCNSLISVLQSWSWVCDFSGALEGLANCTVQCCRHQPHISLDDCITLKCDVHVLNFLKGGTLDLRIKDQSINAILSYRTKILGVRNDTDLLRERLKNHLIKFPIDILRKRRGVLIPCGDFASELQKIFPLLRDDEYLSPVQSATGTDIPTWTRPGGPARTHGADAYNGAYSGSGNQADHNLGMNSETTNASSTITSG
ncbi:hypothetical protein B0T10DRAFT_464972 [Thelonectria olida]|uniref:Uncharacterized protein n=1 Tax=Thelonectria olida TaxID=1576542 RepID=A0A9P8VWX9_9HYPO|nr:hypothetical protein B0T10DRAFT_464972 [Thelonectria olida]